MTGLGAVIEAARAACSGKSADVAHLRGAFAAYDRSMPSVLDEPNGVLMGPAGSAGIGGQRTVILGLLLRHAGSVVSHEAMFDRLYSGVRDGGPAKPTEVVRIQIVKLRKAIERCGAPIRIATVAGTGYQLDLVQENDDGSL